MFNFHLFTEDIRKQLYSAVSIVVTRSEVPQKHQNCLRRVARIIRDPKLIMDHKEEIIALIDDIIQKNRI